MTDGRVVVTGGAGRFGRYVVDEFLGTYDVTVVDKVRPDREVRHVVADVLDLPAISRALKEADAVLHLAGIDSGIEASEHDYFETNVQGTWNVLAAAEALGARKVIVCSSIAAFGLEAVEPRRIPDYLPFDEAHPLRPDVAYDLSKQVCETVAASFARRGRMSVICLRPAWIIFPDKVHDFDRRARIADGDAPLPSDHRPPPPHRAYVRPDDAARCFRLALECDVGPYDVFNVGASDTMSPAPTLEFMRKTYGKRIPTRDPAIFERNPRAASFSNERACRVLGWTPTGDWEAFVRQTASPIEQEVRHDQQSGSLA